MVSIKGLAEDLDIKSDMKTVSTIAVKLTGNSVPVGMKRWITFVKLSNQYKGTNTITLCSSVSSNIASSNIAKDTVTLANRYDLIAYPEKPAQLFSIASTAIFTAISNRGKMDVFIQYYDS